MFNLKQLSIMFIALSAVTTTTLATQGFYTSGAVTTSQAQNMPSLSDVPPGYPSGYHYNYHTDETSHQTGFRLALGYAKDLNPNFGLGGELGYNNYGSEEYSTTLNNVTNDLTYRFSAIDLLAKAAWHINPTWDLYGKLGVAQEYVDVSGDNISNNNDTLPEIGAGTSYFVTPNFSIDLALYYIQGNNIEFNTNDDNNAPSIFSTDLGVSYYFS